jgi:hypothetical protein
VTRSFTSRPACSARAQFLQRPLPFLSIQKPEQREAYVEEYQKINQAVELFPLFHQIHILRARKEETAEVF